MIPIEAFMIFGLLATIWLLRGLIAGTLDYCIFMIWNMFLASVPVLILPLFTFADSVVQGMPLLLCYLAVGLVWLLFLPNSYYLLTCMMHLNQDVLVNVRGNGFKPSMVYERGDAKYIFDSLLMMLTVIFGALLGGLSLDYVFTLVHTQYFSFQYFVVGSAIILSSVGVYIGRFGRWNSWDGITKPHIVLKDFISSLNNKKSLKSFSVIVLTIIIFELLSWLAFLRI
jgi:uncharacterized membrane protein